ncbi:MAG: metallopeptidase TldD-related protein [Litorimonas sp.]
MSLADPITTASLAPALKLLLQKAKQYGATSADAVATHGRSLGVSVRDGALEDVDNSEGRDIGLRVMVGQRQACVSSSDVSERSIDALAQRAVDMARLAPEDPYCGLADDDRLAQNISADKLDLFDPSHISPETLKQRAQDLEVAATSDTRIQQAEGASASHTSSALYFMTSRGFEGGWRATRHGLSVAAFAEQDGAMERDYDSDGTRYLSDLRSPEDIGKKAAELTLARLGSKQMASASLPVMFDQRLSGGLVSAMIGTISGSAISRGISFLKEDLGKMVFNKDIQIIDDPFIVRGHGSRPWDGEGVTVKKQALIKDCVLQSWLLNSASAKQLGLTTTGHASRGIGAPPSIGATNTTLENGIKTKAELLREMGEGLLVTEMFGPSLNSNTGDYSVGVSGFKVESGMIAYPVNEITIAGNLRDMYRTIIPANDIVYDNSVSAPSLLCEGLTIAGQ